MRPSPHEASLIKDDLLEPIDALLDDAELLRLVSAAQAARAPKAETMGRKTMASNRLLRCLVLKHTKSWSFRQLERELRASLVYRRFTRFDGDRIPDHATLSRCFAVLGPEVTKQAHERVVALSRQAEVAKGKRLRTDTTVVESNIHYPTDSTLLQDGVRVLTRAMKRIEDACLPGKLDVGSITLAQCSGGSSRSTGPPRPSRMAAANGSRAAISSWLTWPRAWCARPTRSGRI
jgi:hypothetical protein